jgi:lysozyme
MTLNGIDVSNVNGPFNWTPWKGKIDFAWVKVSEGTGFADGRAAANIAAARKLGLVVGGYHFLHAGSSGSAQAEAFLSHAHTAGLKPGDLVALDAEDLGLDGEDAQQMNLTASAFKAELQRHFAGFSPFLYTEISMAPSLASMGACPLWLANPSGIVVRACGPWKQVSMEQTGQRGVDADVFYGTREQLLKLAIP